MCGHNIQIIRADVDIYVYVGVFLGWYLICFINFTFIGYKIIEFDSLLPGGGFQTQKNSDSTILDCVWVEKNQSYYVLDIICWGKVILLNCEVNYFCIILQSIMYYYIFHF
jgi:hypothetical protein